MGRLDAVLGRSPLDHADERGETCEPDLWLDARARLD